MHPLALAQGYHQGGWAFVQINHFFESLRGEHEKGPQAKHPTSQSLGFLACKPEITKPSREDPVGALGELVRGTL